MYHVCVGMDLLCLFVPLEYISLDIEKALDRLSYDVDAVVEVLDSIQTIVLVTFGSFDCEWIVCTIPLGVIEVPKRLAKAVLNPHSQYVAIIKIKHPGMMVVAYKTM